MPFTTQHIKTVGSYLWEESLGFPYLYCNLVAALHWLWRWWQTEIKWKFKKIKKKKTYQEQMRLMLGARGPARILRRTWNILSSAGVTWSFISHKEPSPSFLIKSCAAISGLMFTWEIIGVKGELQGPGWLPADVNTKVTAWTLHFYTPTAKPTFLWGWLSSLMVTVGRASHFLFYAACKAAIERDLAHRCGLNVSLHCRTNKTYPNCYKKVWWNFNSILEQKNLIMQAVL